MNLRPPVSDIPGQAQPRAKRVEGNGTGANRPGRKLRLFLIVISLGVVLGLLRLWLPSLVRDYVNRTLDRNSLYAGAIGAVRLHLWRGAYSIEDVRVSKTTGSVPTPFFSSKRVDFAIQWDELWHRKVVGRIRLEHPEIDFVDATDKGQGQTGADAPWLQMIADLFPFRINRAVIEDGAIHFRSYEAKQPVDVYLSQVAASVDNLTNVRDELNPLVSTVQAAGLVMAQAKLEFKMMLDPFSYRPTFHLAVRMLGLDVTKINSLALAYGKFDFKRGWFDLVVEAEAKEGQLAGYVKPLFRDLKVVSLAQDIKEDNVLQFFWRALVGTTTSLLKNPPRNQFGTLIPFNSDLSGTVTADILSTVANILRNAFVRAYLPRLENGGDSIDGLRFEAPELLDPISAGDAL
jgi:hypothetical protein